MKSYQYPTIVAEAIEVNDQGSETKNKEVIIAVQVIIDKTELRDGQVDIDIRDYPSNGKITTIRLALPDLVAAISSAALHRGEY